MCSVVEKEISVPSDCWLFLGGLAAGLPVQRREDQDKP